MLRGHPWPLRRDSRRWRTGAVGVLTSASVWLLAEEGFRYAGMVSGLVLILSIGWLSFDGLYSIYLLFWIDRGPPKRSEATAVRAASEGRRQTSGSVEYRKLALDFAWLAATASAFWIGGAVVLHGFP